MDKFKLPDIAEGKIVPPLIADKIAKEEQQNKLRKKQQLHDFIVAFFGAVIGAIITNIGEIVDFIMKLIF